MVTVTASQPLLSARTVVAFGHEYPGRPVWIDAKGTVTWGEFARMIERVQSECDHVRLVPGQVVVTPGEATLDALAWLFGAAQAGAVVAPLRRERMGELTRWADTFALTWRIQQGRLFRDERGVRSPRAAALWRELEQRGHPGLILATGGTTGRPKLVLHDLDALLRTVRVAAVPPCRLMPLLRFDHIGGLDTAWRALGAGHTLVAPPGELTPEAVAAQVAGQRVEILPATPSFLNLLLLAGLEREHDLASLRIIPYGAEPMPEQLLARLRRAFPRVEFVPRFGTSETGALPVRGSGEGMELRNRGGEFEWKVVEGELWVRSPARALGYLTETPGGFEADGWFRTGDMAEILPNGAVRVLGRREEWINVGGEKVLPGEVEDVLLAHPEVADCRVMARANPVLGQVVAAEVVWRGSERDALAVKRVLNAFASKGLARHKLPVSVALVSAIAATGNFKKTRTP